MVAEGDTVPNNINDVLNFTVPDSSGSGSGRVTYYGNSTLPVATLTTGFDKTLKIDDFRIMAADNFKDEDGDALDSITGYTYKWIDRFGVEPANTELLDPCRSPYKLTIEASLLSISSTYGAPRANSYTNLSKTFDIDVNYDTPICYIKPVNLDWIPSDGVSSTVINQNGKGGGYSADFNPEWGFKTTAIASSGKAWPTTAFKAASFELITRELSDTNSHYTFSVLNGAPLTVVNNRFTFTATKPTGNITIQAKNRITSDTYNYIFKIDKWAVPDGNNTYWQWGAAYNCSHTPFIGGGLFAIEEFTNAPVSAFYNGNGAEARFSRAIDGTLQGEWGRLTKYTGTDWHMGCNNGVCGGYYWTKTINTLNTNQALVAFADNGSIRSYITNSTGNRQYQACKL